MKAKRWISLLLTLALLLSLSAPVYAEGPDTETPGQGSEEPGYTGVTILEALDHASLVDQDGTAIPLPWEVQAGDVLIFKILPEEYFHVGKVLAGDMELTPDADSGLYTVTVTESMTLQVEVMGLYGDGCRQQYHRSTPYPACRQFLRDNAGW